MDKKIKENYYLFKKRQIKQSIKIQRAERQAERRASWAANRSSSYQESKTNVAQNAQ